MMMTRICWPRIIKMMMAKPPPTPLKLFRGHAANQIHPLELFSVKKNRQTLKGMKKPLTGIRRGEYCESRGKFLCRTKGERVNKYKYIFRPFLSLGLN